MIRFQDGQNRIETLDARFIGYADIKPSAEITRTEALNYWDDLFSKPIVSKEINWSDIERGVYGRDESEFSFAIDVRSVKVRESLECFRKDTWDNFAVANKVNAISNFEKSLEKMLELSKSPVIRYYEGHTSDCGFYDWSDNSIWINQNNFGDSQEIIDTIAHEMWHAFQFEKSEKLETYDDFLYAYNFANYIIPKETEYGIVNFLDYQDQLIEAEARAFARLFVVDEGRNE